MLLICVVCALVVQSIFVQSFGSPEPTPTVKSSLEWVFLLFGAVVIVCYHQLRKQFIEPQHRATLVTLEEDLLFSSHTAPGVWRAKYDAGQPVCSWEGAFGKQLCC